MLRVSHITRTGDGAFAREVNEALRYLIGEGCTIAEIKYAEGVEDRERVFSALIIYHDAEPEAVP